MKHDSENKRMDRQLNPVIAKNKISFQPSLGRLTPSIVSNTCIAHIGKRCSRDYAVYKDHHPDKS